MCTHVFIIILSASHCFCYAGYELFQGFDSPDVNDTSDTASEIVLNSILNEKTTTSLAPLQIQQNTTKIHLQNKPSTSTAHTIELTTKSKVNRSREITSITNENPIETTKFDCPEEEKPSNIGPYEIPTQRDMVLFTRTMLLDMYNSYNKEAFFLLRDIRAATKATSSVEKKCEGNKTAYKQCVRRASRQCQQITKNIVRGIENQKQEILNLTKVKICNLSEMPIDPIKILKSLAQEKVSLQFALPGFLRLLSACSLLCIQSDLSSNKPSSHLTLTDQDVVIKYFLTRKNYLELIMDSRHKTIANSN